MEKENELTGLQGFIIGIVLTGVILDYVGYINPSGDSFDYGYQYANDNNFREEELCEVRFKEESSSKEGCIEYVYENYYFYGYKCTDDCSGHYAGYEWAEQNNINSEDDCVGNSQSFIEGCKVFVEGNL